MDDSQEHNLGALVTQWYKKNGRQNLPWRKSITPYKVWISEMMLQQTQVVTAQSYYSKFLKKYPSLSSMKMATEDDILSLWSGLGYYRRASFIYQAKEKIFSWLYNPNALDKKAENYYNRDAYMSTLYYYDEATDTKVKCSEDLWNDYCREKHLERKNVSDG